MPSLSSPQRPSSQRFALCLALWLTIVSPLFAHDPGLSSIRVTSAPTGLAAVLTIHAYDLETVLPDLDANHDGTLDPAEFAHARPALARLARQAVLITLAGDTPLAPSTDPQVTLIENNNVQMHLRFPALLPGSPLEISSELVPRLPGGHRQFVEVADAAGKSLGEGFLSAGDDRLSLRLPALPTGGAKVVNSGQVRFGEFFFLGVNHLLTGYDHLLFLGGLLIVCRSLLKAFQMLTLFTIAHSVTLTLVTLNLIKAPSALIEPTIAASIAYIGIENIFRPKADLSWRGVLTFAFGLIHGMGFAGALKELGVGSDGGGVFRPLFYFSLGLETTQLSLAALVFPFLLWFRTMPAFPRLWVPASSGLIAFAGIFWFVQRVFFGG